ncbi:hypothetical protein D3C71_1328680 [compost metagenome]
MPGQALFIDLLGVGRKLGFGCQHRAGGLKNVPTPTVVGGNRQMQAVVVRGACLRGHDQLLQAGFEGAQVADDMQPHALLVQLADLALQRLHEQAHQQRDLFGGPAPVLGTEGKQRQVAHPGAPTGLDHAAHGLHALGMAGSARQQPPRSPSPVAIHDDGDVFGYVASIGNRLGRTGCHGCGAARKAGENQKYGRKTCAVVPLLHSGAAKQW